MQITTIGFDLAKNVFQVHGIDVKEKVVARKQLRRGQVMEDFKALPPCLIGMEACATAHYWARELTKLGHEVRLMPAKDVKAYVKRNKNGTAAYRGAAVAPVGRSGWWEKPKKSGRVFTVSSTRTGAINKDGLLKHLREYRTVETVHGMRASFGSWAEDARFMPDVIEASLAHEKGDNTAKAYRRSKLLPARRELMDA